VKRHPVASVDLHRPMAAARELRRCVRELGLRVLRIVPWLWDLPPDDRRYYPLYAECIDLGIPFCLQVGHTGPLCDSACRARRVNVSPSAIPTTRPTYSVAVTVAGRKSGRSREDDQADLPRGVVCLLAKCPFDSECHTSEEPITSKCNRAQRSSTAASAAAESTSQDSSISPTLGAASDARQAIGAGPNRIELEARGHDSRL
jgi:Amidohydrolase